MTEIGDIKFGREINKVGENQKYIWADCLRCHKPRWVRLSRFKRGLGNYCQGHHPRNNSYRKVDKFGYVYIKISSDNPYYSMADNRGWIKEHRYILANHLGRLLLKQELVHHKNGIKEDNRLMNLELVSPIEHGIYQICNNCELRKEIRLLRFQLKQFLSQEQFKLL